MISFSPETYPRPGSKDHRGGKDKKKTKREATSLDGPTRGGISLSSEQRHLSVSISNSMDHRGKITSWRSPTEKQSPLPPARAGFLSHSNDPTQEKLRDWNHFANHGDPWQSLQPALANTCPSYPTQYNESKRSNVLGSPDWGGGA